MSNGYYANGTNGHHKTAPAPVELAMLYNETAERAVLGSLIIDPDVYGYVRPVVDVKDFYLVRHQWVYDVITTLIESGEQADYITLSDRLERKDKAPDGGWDAFLMGLTLDVPTSYGAESYAKTVREYAIRRRMVLAAAHISQAAINLETPLEDAITSSEVAALNMRGSMADQGVKNAKELSREWLDRFETLMDGDRGIAGLPTGFLDLDRLLLGLENQFYILAARPGMGKTSLALSMVLNVALKQKKRVMFFSLEMNETQMVNRMIAAMTGIPLKRIRVPSSLQQHEYALMYEALGTISNSQLFIDATPGQWPAQMRAKALRKSMQVGGLDLIVIDHLHIVVPDNGKLVDTAAMTNISKAVMTFPKLFGCPLLALAQLSRSVEQRADKRPMLSDLRQSGSLEEDAYGVMFLYRDDYYEKELSVAPGIAELDTAKNRDGNTGTVNLFWDAERATFKNLQKVQ